MPITPLMNRVCNKVGKSPQPSRLRLIVSVWMSCTLLCNAALGSSSPPAAPAAAPTTPPAAPTIAVQAANPDRDNRQELRALRSDINNRCKTARDKLAEVERDRNRYCSAISGGRRGGGSSGASLTDGLGGGGDNEATSSFGRCIQRADACENTLRVPIGMMSGGGMGGGNPGPTVPIDPNCQFLLVGSCKDNEDRAKDAREDARRFEDDIAKNRQDITKAQEEMAKAGEDLQKQMMELNNRLDQIPEQLHAKMLDIDVETQKRVEQEQQRMAEARGRMSTLTAQMRQADIEAQGAIDEENAKCVAERLKAQEEANKQEKDLRDNQAKRRTENMQATMRVLHALKRQAERAFNNCMRGPLRNSKLRLIYKQRESRLMALQEEINNLQIVVQNQQKNLAFFMDVMEDRKQTEIRQANLALERTQQMLQSLNQASMSQNYFAQIRTQQINQQGEMLQTRMGQAQQMQQMYQAAAQQARQAGDDCSGKGKSGSENLAEARAASVNLDSALGDVAAACCDADEYAMLQNAMAIVPTGTNRAPAQRASQYDPNGAYCQGIQRRASDVADTLGDGET